MRHFILSALAVATAFWLAPAFHVLPQHKKDVAIAAIIAVFFVADLAIGRRKKSRTRVPAMTYGVPAPARGRRGR
jgi:uncharacterized membrane protein YgaE (UPF0421/DUF939 family)